MEAGDSAVGSGGVSPVVQHQGNWNQESPPLKSWYPRASPNSPGCRIKLWVFNLVYFVSVASPTPETCFLQVDTLGVTTILQGLYGETWEAKGQILGAGGLQPLSPSVYLSTALCWQLFELEDDQTEIFP